MIVKDKINLPTFSLFEAGYSAVREAESILATKATALCNDIYEEKTDEKIAKMQELVSIKDTRSERGWDGHDAQPVSSVSLKNALTFLILSPEKFPAPAPGVCANGHITLEWRLKGGRLLSLAFDENNKVSFIVFLPYGEITGGEMSADLGYNETIIYFLNRVYNK